LNSPVNRAAGESNEMAINTSLLYDGDQSTKQLHMINNTGLNFRDVSNLGHTFPRPKTFGCSTRVCNSRCTAFVCTRDVRDQNRDRKKITGTNA
jgi:hypothetical protein